MKRTQSEDYRDGAADAAADTGHVEVSTELLDATVPSSSGLTTRSFDETRREDRLTRPTVVSGKQEQQ